jgi:uncharacterized protein YeeX (DUF496 family)
MIVISEDILWMIIPGCIVLLIILLLLRLKIQIKRTVKNEIYDHFPSIKNKIEDYERRVEYFKLQIGDLERRMKEMEKKLKI